MNEEFEVPQGSVAAGDRVLLPRGAEPPITVFINGVEQRQGADYRIEGAAVVFNRPILKEAKVGLGRWLAMFIGLFGTYRRNETVDVQFSRDGRLQLASDMPVHGAEEARPDPHERRRH